jgi:hypothetical protein
VNAFQRTAEEVSLQADRPARVTVVIPVCLNAQCSHDPKAECTATVTGDRIDITSHASFLQDSGVCPQDCQGLSADCVTPPLRAGTYLVRHGADTMTVSIPSVRPVPCMGTTSFDGSLARLGVPPRREWEDAVSSRPKTGRLAGHPAARPDRGANVTPGPAYPAGTASCGGPSAARTLLRAASMDASRTLAVGPA